jgi:hypothetical protein
MILPKVMTTTPTNRQEGLRLLDMFTTQDTCKPTVISEGSSFGTVGESQSYDIEYWKNKTCRCCGEKGHPGWSHTPEEQAKSRKAQQQEKKRKKIKKESKGSDEESVGSTKTKKSTKSSKTATSKQEAALEEAAKAFATVVAANMDTHEEEDDSDTYSY